MLTGPHGCAVFNDEPAVFIHFNINGIRLIHVILNSKHTVDERHVCGKKDT